MKGVRRQTTRKDLKIMNEIVSLAVEQRCYECFTKENQDILVLENLGAEKRYEQHITS